MTQKNLCKTQTHRHRKQICGCQGRVAGEKNWEFGISRCKLLYTGWISKKILLYSTENYTQYSVIKHNGKTIFLKSIYIYIHIHTYIQLNHSEEEINTTVFQFKKKKKKIKVWSHFRSKKQFEKRHKVLRVHGLYREW